MNFHTPTPHEFENHRSTCPLEIGRYVYDTSGNINELIGPLPIYRIWTSNDEISKLRVSELNGDSSKLYGPIDFLIGDDNLMYTQQGETHISITQI